MLDQNKVFSTLSQNGVTFFTGVPDSFLNGFCDYAQANLCDRNIVAANEGIAIGIAAGHYFASREIPLVYMQNSGMGNALNPLVSLVDKSVYGIPMILLIGWRGQGDTEPDHPQHHLQGEITPKLLDILHIPYSILTGEGQDFEEAVRTAVDHCQKERGPYALVAPKGVMANPVKSNTVDTSYPLSREEAIEVILDHMPKDTIYSATTGRATRELFFLRQRRGESHDHDYLNLGAMGHASSVALGIALEAPNRNVVALDGDSALLMHMGVLTTMAEVDAPNYMHIVLNNGAHESVGGQPSVGQRVDLTSIAEACGYTTVGEPVTSEEELIAAIKELAARDQAAFIDCRIHKGLSRELPPLIFDQREAVDALIDGLNS